MSDYGLQLWNSSGELVYDSRLKTLQVIASGVCTFKALSDVFTISFPAQSAQPELYMGNGGCFYYAGTGGAVTLRISPVAGAFTKGVDGKYSSLTIKCTQVGTGPQSAEGVGSPPLPWQIPYVIFI